MPQFCAAIGCSNSSVKPRCRENGVSFHRFPKEEPIRSLWLKKLRRANFVPGTGSLLCSDHFNDDDFEFQIFTNRKLIKKTAVPSKLSFNSSNNRSRKRKLSDKDSSEENVYDDEEVSRPAVEHISEDLQAAELTLEQESKLLELSMNERFYNPVKLRQLAPQEENPKVRNLSDCSSAQILLRTLKKQLLEAELKAVSLKKDYYEKKKTLLPQLYYAENSDDDDDLSDKDYERLQVIHSQILEEKLAAKVEKRILRSQLLDTSIKAAHSEAECKTAKRDLILRLTSSI